MAHDSSSGLAVRVIIPHFNAPEDLEAALVSIHSHGHGIPFDAVVVDNSTDEHSRRSAKRIASEHAATFMGMDGNVGFAAACNAGAADAEASVLFFFNQDARLLPGTLELLVEHLAASPNCAAVSPAIVTPEGRTWFNGGSYSDRSGRVLLPGFGGPLAGGEPLNSGFLSGCAFMVRRDVFESQAGFDERFFLYYEDVDLSQRIRNAGWNLAVVPDAVVVHHRGQSGDPLRNLSEVMLTHSIRSRRIFGTTRPGSARWVAAVTLPLEAMRLWVHAVRANPRGLRSTTSALWRGLKT